MVQYRLIHLMSHDPRPARPGRVGLTWIWDIPYMLGLMEIWQKMAEQLGNMVEHFIQVNPTQVSEGAVNHPV